MIFPVVRVYFRGCLVALVDVGLRASLWRFRMCFGRVLLGSSIVLRLFTVLLVVYRLIWLVLACVCCFWVELGFYLD